MTTPILQVVIWTILFLVTVSVFLQFFARISVCQETNRIDELIIQDKKLNENIMELHKQISNLNRDLERLAKENAILRKEVRALNDRVNKLQNHIVGWEDKNATSNN